MPSCDYCGESFQDEDALLKHLDANHREELGRIDRRRVDAATGGGGLPIGTTGTVVGVLVLAVLGFLVGAFVLGGSGGSPNVDAATEPTDLHSVHYHGTMEVVIDGQSIDFSQDRYQKQANAFHYESNEGDRWHVHARQVTLEWALATLGFDITADTVTVDGTTYADDDPNETVTVQVNGESVVPSEYVLQEGDHVVIRASRTG